MPLKLSIGIAKKIGQPDYGSLGASCGLELDLPELLLISDREAFRRQVSDAYAACHQAVNDELARHQAPTAPPPSNGQAAPANGTGPPTSRTGGARSRPRKPATASQVKAIYAIARAGHADLEGVLRDEYGVDRPEELSLSEASQLIDQLKAAAAI
jgi:hypothetical protein